MNLIAFVGQVREVPMIKVSAAGNKFASMVISVPRSFANSEGIKEQDELTFTLWKGIAETACAISRVGDDVAIRGRLQSHTFEGKDGLQHRSYDLIAENVTFLKHDQ